MVWNLANRVNFDEYFEQEELFDTLDSFLDEVLGFEQEVMKKLEA